MTAIQTTPSDLERKKKTTQVKQSHEWHTFEFTLRGVAKTAQGRRGGGERKKGMKKRETLQRRTTPSRRLQMAGFV